MSTSWCESLSLICFYSLIFYFIVFIRICIRSCISMSSYMYLCMCMCMWMCECKSEVKKTQDNVVVVVVKWRKEFEKKTRQSQPLFFLSNSTQHTSTSSQLTHLLTQTDRQTKKERKTCIALQQRQRHLYCSSTNTLLSFFPTQLHFSSTSTFPLLLKVYHFSLFSTQALVFLSNKDSCFVRLRCSLRLRCRVTESSSSQTNRQTVRETERQSNKGEREMQRWR